MYDTDCLIFGSGLAGLALALRLADHADVLICTKASPSDANSAMAQGGIAAVIEGDDSFEQHLADTVSAGAGLVQENRARAIIERGPACIEQLERWGVHFDRDPHTDLFDLGREGGHGRRRILHIADHTGEALHKQLLAQVLSHPRIQLWHDTYGLELVLNRHLNPHSVAKPRCLGAYVLNRSSGEVRSIRAKSTFLATGGAGKVYLYTSNWSGATGDGLALAYRAGCRLANLEFMQFHPTCLYHPQARNFLVSEALRGEGAELVDASGRPFMKEAHANGSLAPRDIVARAIDAEMKKTGSECVFLDATHHSREFLENRFPLIFRRCLELGINMSAQPIPVVPAAHYLCGGVVTDEAGQTDVDGLFALGETACTGLHGANRLASNSLLECLVVSANAADVFLRGIGVESSEMAMASVDNRNTNPLGSLESTFSNTSLVTEFPDWPRSQLENADEMIVVHHMWDEIRRLMWNYVGIVRTDRRLERAAHRLENVQREVADYYSSFKTHSDIEELRNIALVAQLTIRSALQRQESRGIHYNLDHLQTNAVAVDTVV